IEKGLEDLEVVETKNIDITGRREDFTVRVRLKEPTRYSRFPGGDTVEFFGIVQEKTILQTVEDVDLIAIDLDEQFEVEGIPDSNSLQVQGKQPVLEEHSSEDYRLTFDCSEIEEPGTYTIDVSPDVPRDVLVLSYEPRTINVEVSLPEEEN
ncbi:MAG: hypothetical protein R6V67_06100, partial [Spirochaetia bacterium]